MARHHTMRHRMATSDRQQEIGGVDTFWHERQGDPVLYLHGVPTDGDDWLPFLERTGGLAPDLPGFGRSGKPPHFDYSIPGYARWVRAFVDTAGLERFSLVVHDWGAVGLALAQEIPERIERLVVIDAVPFLPGYQWHRAAGLWRTPLLGELAMGLTFKRVMSRAGVPDALIDRAYERFDHGTQRAILKLYRSAPPQTLEAAGARLAEIRAPALVVWGDRDEYLPTKFAELYAERLGGETRVEIAEGAGHWPWVERPELVETVTGFLRGA
jgi:pimeloyl-ACP methyl ester carboxylesterase